jgi:Ca-activated chloride channel homolog
MIAHDDPRLTAYALGELDDDERAAVEAAVAGDPEARAAIEAIRATSGLLTEALQAEGRPELTPAQRQAIRAQAAPRPRPVPVRQAAHPSRKVFAFPNLSWLRPYRALAAAVVVAVGLGALALQINVGPVLYWLNNVRTSRGHEDATRESAGDVRLTLGDVLMGRAGNDVRGTVEQRYGLDRPALSRVLDSPTSEPAADASTFGQTGAYAPAIPPALIPGVQDTQSAPWNTEAYDRVVDNPFRTVQDEPLSTFSIDVDTASYANVRRFLTSGQVPPPDAVRIEELLNYFEYDYEPPAAGDDTPFAVHVEVADAPWKPEHRLVRIGLKGREIDTSARPAANLVFLIDVSGSMADPNKLPLVQAALGMLAQSLRADDRVAIAVYAGASGLVLPSTSGGDRETIRRAIDYLSAGGSTNGGEGIELAYRTATANMIEGGVNRVILATDGDFNVGVTDQGSLIRMVETNARRGVFLTVLGFGMGNYKDSTLEQLADKGNGNYAYIDTENEARKVLVDQVSGTMVTIAKDVKIQVEFNPTAVSAYRLIGYENRMLASQDFNDDAKDAGEIGAGHAVTALYEVVPVGVPIDVPGVDPLKYQQSGSLSAAAGSGEILNLKLRYKAPDALLSTLREFPVNDPGATMTMASPDMKFAAAVAEFGMLLRGSDYRGAASWAEVYNLAIDGLGTDAKGYRREFLGLVQTAQDNRQY